MPTFESGGIDVWSVVKVPFPYTDRPVRQRRPALVVAAGRLTDTYGMLWVAMITSSENRGWDGDVAVSDIAEAGLPAESIVRTAKLATIDLRDADLLGRLPVADRAAVANGVSAHLAMMMKAAGR